MKYTDFLLVMLTEIAVFTGLVTAGILTRKRPEIHRAMMLSASLSLLLGATTRIPWMLVPFGGEHSRVAFFGPVFLLGAILTGVHSLQTRKFDRWLATGYVVMVVVFLAAEQFSRTDAWGQVTAVLLKK
jgi:membrane-associated PAP2 superfamily phosphatase